MGPRKRPLLLLRLQRKRLLLLLKPLLRNPEKARQQIPLLQQPQPRKQPLPLLLLLYKSLGKENPQKKRPLKLPRKKPLKRLPRNPPMKLRKRKKSRKAHPRIVTDLGSFKSQIVIHKS